MQSMIAEEQAYQSLKQMIVQAELRPGTRLVHRKLAKELGMSPVPVVLALRLLERDGMVINVPGMGAYVRTWNRSELIDLYHIRASQEAIAARFCAERATRVDLSHVIEAKEEYIEAVAKQDVKIAIEKDTAFHLALVQGAHCSYLEALVKNLSLVNLSINMLRFNLKSSAHHLSTEDIWLHIPIVEALEKRNADAAAQAVTEHIEKSLEFQLAWFEENADVWLTLQTSERQLNS